MIGFSDILLLTKPNASTVQGKIKWNYDNIRRLTATRYPSSIVSGDSAIYAYDEMGNRTSKTSGGSAANYTYNNAANQLLSNGGSYSYDNNGNLIEKDLPNQSQYYYAYDFENRLNKAKYTLIASDSVRMEYDGLGQRRRKVGTTDTTRYTWDGLYPIVEWNNQGKLKQTFVYANGLLLGLIDSTLSTNRRFFVLHDGLGSSICMANDSARVVRSLIYSDFGSSLVDTSAANTPALNRLYGGYPWDGSPANFYWMPGRQTFDPIIGRFSQEDIWPGSATDMRELNLYVYADNSPILMVDPLGFYCIPWSTGSWNPIGKASSYKFEFYSYTGWPSFMWPKGTCHWKYYRIGEAFRTNKELCCDFCCKPYCRIVSKEETRGNIETETGITVPTLGVWLQGHLICKHPVTGEPVEIGSERDPGHSEALPPQPFNPWGPATPPCGK